MERTIKLSGVIVPYTLRTSKRARSVNITIDINGELTVSLPENKSLLHAENFLREKGDWILRNIDELSRSTNNVLPNLAGERYEPFKKYAQDFILKKVHYFNNHYDLTFNKVYVKSMKSQWGSCTFKKNLNFTYKLIFLPEELADYIIVHELCHLKEMNHKAGYWRLVGEMCPTYQELEKKLKQYHLV